MAHSDTVPVILRVDVEPDGLFIDRSVPAPWKGYEGAFAFFQSARHRMATATDAPAHLSWFFRMDPQIEETYGSAEWPAAHYAAYLPALLRNVHANLAWFLARTDIERFRF